MFISCIVMIGLHILHVVPHFLQVAYTYSSSHCPSLSSITPVPADSSTILSKSHPFISPSLRCVYLGDAEDSRREDIVGPELELPPLKHTSCDSHNVFLVRGLKALLAAQCAVPRLTSVESAPCLALDQVTAEARVTLDNGKEEARFAPDSRTRRRTPSNESGSAQGCV